MSPTKGLPRIPEVLRTICEFLQSDKVALARLASTCRMFEDPALDALWFELDGFYQLAKRLPEHTWEEEEHEDRNIYLVLKLPLSSTDCKRLSYYAKKVKIFTTNSETGAKRVHPSVYQGLQFSVPDIPLLPNMRKLTWYCTDNLFPFIFMFLGPHITNVEYQFSPDNSAQLSFLTALSERYPALRKATIIFYDEAFESSRRQACHFISSAVHKWENLQFLKVARVTYAALVALSGLSSLRHLEIEECYFHESKVTPVISGGGFPALNYLVFQSCNSVEDSAALLNTLPGNSDLYHFEIKFQDILSSADWKKVFLAVNQNCCHQSLGAILCADGLDLGEQQLTISSIAEMIDGDVLRPLLAFQGLSLLILEASKGFYFADPTIIADIAKRWRKATYLHVRLRDYSRALPRSMITLQDLIPLAQHCRRLETLTLTIDALNPPKIDPNAIPGGVIHETSLKRLDVGYSPINNPELVAANLSAIFPTLQSVMHDFDRDDRDAMNPDGFHKRWVRVHKLVKLFSAVRNQGRLHERQCGGASKEEDDNS